MQKIFKSFAIRNAICYLNNMIPDYFNLKED